MTGCELCERPARMYCESDKASLCWECDARVHGANFLVARHSRWLLCRRCQRPTPWRAEGARLGPTFSVCERCCAVGEAKVLESDDEEDEGDDDDVEEEEEEEEGREAVVEDEEGEDGDNQVVPWAMIPLPPPAISSTSEEEESSKGHPKRMQENADPAGAQAQDNRASSSSHPSILDGGCGGVSRQDRRRSGDDAGPGTGTLRTHDGRNISAVGFTQTPSRSPPI